MAGGIRIPTPQAAETMAVARGRLYPFSVSWGTMIPPIAAASADVEPETAEKNISAMMTTWPSPPGKCPTMDRASVTRRRLIPPTSMRNPARMKSGTASIGKESIPATICCADDYERQVRSYDDNASGTREGETNRDSSQHQPSERTEKEATHQFVPFSCRNPHPLARVAHPTHQAQLVYHVYQTWSTGLRRPGSSLSSDLANRWTTISTPATGTEA